MEESQSIVRETLGYVIAIASGVLGTIITTKWLNKEVVLTKRIFVQKMAASSNSNYWGKIDVLYNDAPCNNLHFVTVEVRNESNKNIEDVEVVFKVLEQNSIYANSGRYKQDEVFTPLLLTDKYFSYFMDVAERNKTKDQLDENARQVLQNEIDHVVREKRYHMPVLNKSGMGVFSFLIDNATNLEPELMVSVVKKDVRLALYQEEEDRKEAQTKWVGIITLFVLLGISYLVYQYSTSIMLAVGLMVLNVFVAHYISLAIYRISHWAKNYLG